MSSAKKKKPARKKKLAPGRRARDTTEVPGIVLILMFRNGERSHELGPALWAALKEVEALYSKGSPSTTFERHYLASPEGVPAGIRREMLEANQRACDELRDSNLWSEVREQSKEALREDKVWHWARGKYGRTFDGGKILDKATEVLSLQRDARLRVVVTDAELTPPSGYRYIVWLEGWTQAATVISLAPMDPLYWGDSDVHRIATIKHRGRTACCAVVGPRLGLEPCNNHSCFLYRPVDSVVDLDEMIYIGSEHNRPEWTRYGFTARVNDPATVQLLSHDPYPAPTR